MTNEDKLIQKLKDENLVLRKFKRDMLRYENSLEEVASCNIAKNIFKPYKYISDNKKDSVNGTCLFLSDIHINKKVNKSMVSVNEFNLEVLNLRVKEIIKQTIEYKYKTKNLDIFLGGDILDGIIHNGNIKGDMGIVGQQEYMYNMIMNIVMECSRYFNKIRLHCVMGNHSRVTPHIEYDRKFEDFEYIVYLNIEREFKYHKNFEINISKNGYLLQDVNNKTICLMHGDQDRGFKANSKGLAALQTKLDYLFKKHTNHLLVGHFHYPTTADSGFGGKIIQNASVPGMDEYTLGSGFAPARPSQTLFFVNKNGDIENIHQFYLDI